MIYLLLFIIFGLFLLDIFIEEDIFSPMAILCESYLLAVLCAIWNIDNWQIQLGMKTVYILVLGLITFFITSLVTKSIFKSRHKKMYVENEELGEYGRITIKKTNMMFLLVVQMSILIIYVYFFIKTVGTNNFLKFSDMMTSYRTKFITGTAYENSIPSIVSNLTKLSKASAFISLYIFIYEKVFFNKVNIIYVLSWLLYLPLVILTGGRFDLITFLLAFIIIYYILDRKKKNKNGINFKTVGKMVIIIFIILVIFSSSRSLVGRTNESGFIDYITLYFGGSIELFDLYLKESDNNIFIDNDSNNLFGKYTFFGLNKFLGQIGIINNNTEALFEFRYTSNHVTIGNVYTAYRAMYQDFGIMGIVILQIIFAIIMNSMYEKIKLDKNIDTINLSIIFYGMIIYTLFLHSFSEMFYRTIISFNYFMIYICLVFVKFFLTKVKIKR